MVRKIYLLLCLAIITTVVTACNSGNDQEQGTPPPEPTVNSDAASSDNPNEVDSSLDADLVQVPEGGFAFRPAAGYQLEISGGNVLMLAPGADPDLGPVIQIMGMLSEQETTVSQLYEQLLFGTDMQLGPDQEISIGGEKGLLVDMAGGANDTDKRGQILLFVIDGHQQFVLMSGSTNAGWEDFAPVVDVVLASIQFIELIPAEKTSSLPGGTYFYTNRNVIRDLDEKDGIVYAATLGGLVTWRIDTNNSMQVVPMTGMGHISANSVVYCEIPEPRVLVGTLQGVSIFNPNTGLWEQNDLFPEDSKVNTSKIERLYCDQANQRLLVGYSGLGVLDLTSGEFVQYTDQTGLLWNSITDITVNGKDIWVATGYKGVARISNGQVTTFSKADEMPDESASAITFGSDGTLWVGASSGLMSFKNGAWKLYGSDSPAKLSGINEIELVSEKSLWVATASLGGGRLCLFDIATTSCIQDYPDQDYAPIIALTTSVIAEPIYGTSKGISVLKNASSAMQQMKTSDQLVSNYVDALAVAPDGMLWVGTDGGVQVLDPADPTTPWTTYQQKEQSSMGGNWATGIAFSSNGDAWIAMINGSASRYQNGQWLAFTDIYSFNAVAVDAQGRTWFADDSKGIIVLDAQGQQEMTFTTANGLPSDNVQALLRDGNGTIWIGTNQGLAKYENETLTVVFGKDSKEIPNVYVRGLALDQNGNLLIGTFTGVSRYDGQTAVTLVDFLKDGFSDARLTNLACRSDGEVWIGTDKGLLHGFAGSGWTMMTAGNGLLTNYISALIVDQYDAIWVGGGGSNFDGGGLVQIVP